MDGPSDQVREQITAAEALLRAAHEAIKAALALAQGAEATERDLGPMVLDLAELVGKSGQAHDGELVQLLAQAQRLKANRGGLTPWIATHLDVTQGAARGIDQSAREIGHLPELFDVLSSGTIGAATMRLMTRTARAVKGTQQDLSAALNEALELSLNGSVREANRHVQILEETLDPGRAERRLARQRERNFARIMETESGMVRLEALLDEESATTMRQAIDAHVAAGFRIEQYDGVKAKPDAPQITAQRQAAAVVRFAEVYLNATAKERGAKFTPHSTYTAPMDPTEDAGLAENAYGQMLSRLVMAPLGHPAAHVLIHDNDGQPIRLDGRLLDKNPAGRLATQDQRIGLAWRDKHCTAPGCDRPTTWSLHAHHVIPHSENGPTTMANLVLLCPEHHTLAHHPGL